MLWLHPLAEVANLLCGIYVLYLGWQRFAFAHLKRKTMFLWKRHVLLGTVVMAVWVGGMAWGLGMAWQNWGAVFVTGLHYQGALAMLPFIAFGYLSGYVMHKHKAKRKVLPLAHAANNLLLVLMTVMQLSTGALVVKDFLIP